MLCIELMLKFGSFIFIVFHFLIPEVIEVVHFLLMGFVDLMDLIFVSDFHFVDSSEIELFF